MHFQKNIFSKTAPNFCSKYGNFLAMGSSTIVILGKNMSRFCYSRADSEWTMSDGTRIPGQPRMEIRIWICMHGRQ